MSDDGAGLLSSAAVGDLLAAAEQVYAQLDELPGGSGSGA